MAATKRCWQLSATVLGLLFLTDASVFAEPIHNGAIQVIDGDTISARGQTVRLVGFDTPEPENLARCEWERSLAAKATGKLRQIKSLIKLTKTLGPGVRRVKARTLPPMEPSQPP